MYNDKAATGKSVLDLRSLVQIFLKQKFLILGGAALGLAIAGALLVVTQPSYEASALIGLAQLRGLDRNNLPTTQLIEQPAEVIERFNSPAAYPDSLVKLCSLPTRLEPGVELLNAVKIKSPNLSAPNLISVTVRTISPEAASNCIKQIFKILGEQQDASSESMRKGLVDFRDKLRVTVETGQDAIQNDKTIEQPMFQGQVGRDTLYYARKNLDQLEFITRSYQPAKIISLYSSPVAVSPRAIPILILGLILGLLIGALAGCARAAYSR